jgi:hypothetical protein
MYFYLVNGEMESFYVLISPDLISSMKELFTYEISLNEKNCNDSPPSNDIELDVPSPAKSISQYIELDRKKSSVRIISTVDQRMRHIFLIR